MSSNVSTEEAQAILDEVGAEPSGPEIAPRDFDRPLRLGAARLAELRKALLRAVPEVRSGLSTWLRRAIAVEIEDVTEADARKVFEDASAPFCALSFHARDAAGPSGWLVWGATEAACAAEIVLGSDPRGRTGPLSALERALVQDVLASAATKLAGALGIAIHGPELRQDQAELEIVREEARAGDPQRVCIHVALTGIGSEPSTLRLYVPGIQPGTDAAAKRKAAKKLPPHLSEVQVEIGAFLGSADVPLAELLALEVGDVLTLGVGVGAPVEVHVEERPCATAQWGQHRGNLVLRIRDLDVPVDEIL